ncbi:MAG: PAS domain-containing sensor histidine kinase [Leptospiraceae bacterium]|nr:PAS domain-containing sensor histidine kinase [Leptospiraceae bacterium]
MKRNYFFLSISLFLVIFVSTIWDIKVAYSHFDDLALIRMNMIYKFLTVLHGHDSRLNEDFTKLNELFSEDTIKFHLIESKSSSDYNQFDSWERRSIEYLSAEKKFYFEKFTNKFSDRFRMIVPIEEQGRNNLKYTSIYVLFNTLNSRKAVIVSFSVIAHIIVYFIAQFLLYLYFKKEDTYIQAVLKSKEKYRKLFTNMQEAYGMINSKGEFIEVNSAYLKLFGYTDYEELKQFKAQDLWVDLTFREKLRKQIAKDNKYEFKNVPFKRKDSSLIYLDGSGFRFKDENGEIYSSTILLDVTERIKYERSLEELNASKDKFFSIIAHDLKNPFNGILGFTDLILMNIGGMSKEKIQEMIVNIKKSADRAFHLLENLLLWASSHTNRIQFNPINNEINSIIMENIELCNTIASNKNIKMKFETEKLYYGIIDRNMISTVIRNLLTNAIKFSRPQTEIIISVNKSLKDYEVSIQDFGIGIAEEDVSKLFKIDDKIVRKDTSGNIGSGLGLMICKEFIERHGGKIWAESKINLGTKFTFSIPKRIYKEV